MKFANAAYTALGHFMVALGIIGVALPIMPTAPFLIAAAFFYSKGSPRFERWLLDHRYFGPMVRNWRDHRAIDPRAKLISAIVLTSSATMIAFVFPFARWLKALLAGTMMAALAFILSRPSAGDKKP